MTHEDKVSQQQENQQIVSGEKLHDCIDAQMTTGVCEQTTLRKQEVPLLVTTVDIAPGVSVQLEIYDGEDPLEVSKKFCAEHGLPESVVTPLKEHIEDNLSSEDGVQECDVPQADMSDPIEQTYSAQGEDSLLMTRANEAVAEVAAALESLAASKRDSRPASAISSLGTEYYGRAELPLSMQRSEEAETADAADRLYADHFRKQMMLNEQRRIQELENQLKMQQAHITETSRLLAAHRTADGYDSYGDRLYREGLQESKKREEMRRYLKAQQIEEEMAEATFRPKISKLAQSLKARSYDERAGDETWRRLYNVKASLEAKKKSREDAIRKERDEQEMKECSFRPQLSRKSERIMEQRRGFAQSSLSSYDRLHYLGNQQKANLEIKKNTIGLPYDATFAPQINKLSIRKAERFNRNGPADVADRLLIRGQVYNERLIQARDDIRRFESKIDPVTGQKLFHPKTNGRGPKNAREHVDPSNVGEHLYQEALESAKRSRNNVRETQERIDQAASKAYVNASSQKMMNRLKLDRIKAVYAYLARTPSDCFPPESIDIINVVSNETFMDTIDPEVRADVEYAAKLAMRRHAKKQGDLSDGEASALSIDEERSLFITESEFVDLMDEVIQRTRGYTRAYLLPMPGMRAKWEEPTFKPMLDKNSMHLASRVRPNTVPSYEILYNSAADTAAKIQELKQELDAQEMEQCTFKPVLESSADTRPSKGKAMAQATQEIRHLSKHAAKESLFHVSHIDSVSHSEAESPVLQCKSVAPIPATMNKEARNLYDGIDAIESEIKDAIAQLASYGSTPRKDAIDFRESLKGSIDCAAPVMDTIPSSFDKNPSMKKYDLHVNI